MEYKITEDAKEIRNIFLSQLKETVHKNTNVYELGKCLYVIRDQLNEAEIETTVLYSEDPEGWILINESICKENKHIDNKLIKKVANDFGASLIDESILIHRCYVDDLYKSYSTFKELVFFLSYLHKIINLI